MNIRLKKEFQSLFWPWVVIAAIGLLPLINWALQMAGFVRTDKFIYFLANSTYVIGVVLLAAIPLGMEFQERTWTSLFSQPCTRSQILRDKLLVSATAILTVTLLHIIGCSRWDSSCFPVFCWDFLPAFIGAWSAVPPWEASSWDSAARRSLSRL
jgi:hypothetical protein